MDFTLLWYRDESLLFGMGEPYQLLAKADDAFSGGRFYYSHPSNLEEYLSKILQNYTH